MSIKTGAKVNFIYNNPIVYGEKFKGIMVLSFLKISLFALMLSGLMGTSCIRSGVVYKAYQLNQCPPVTFTMPLWVKNNRFRVEIDDKPVWKCPRFASFQFFRDNTRESPLYYATIHKEKDACQLLVGFNAAFQGMAPESELSDIKKSYDYKAGVESIDDFASTLFSNTILKISVSEDIKHTDYKTDLRKWCEGKGAFDG